MGCNKFRAYESIFMVGFSSPCFYKKSDNQIVLIEDEIGEVFIINDDNLLSLGFEWNKNFESKDFRPATRKEIKAAGLWAYVINKEDYSSEQDKIETELEEYLRLGSDIENSD